MDNFFEQMCNKSAKNQAGDNKDIWFASLTTRPIMFCYFKHVSPLLKMHALKTGNKYILLFKKAISFYKDTAVK